jgi:hypothetical protein
MLARLGFLEYIVALAALKFKWLCCQDCVSRASYLEGVSVEHFCIFFGVGTVLLSSTYFFLAVAAWINRI